MSTLYPLRFQEILRNYSFGNRWIVSAYEKGPFPADHRVAETWEVCDRPGESSTVVNGPLAGATLHELIERFGADLLGRDVVARCGTRFPLLIKLLDVSNPLAEQAHHSDELAQARGLPDPGKTEAWYMLRTLPGATIHCGAKPGLTPEAALQAILNGSSRELMREYPVQPGDAFLLHAGTMHYSDGRDDLLRDHAKLGCLYRLASPQPRSTRRRARMPRLAPRWKAPAWTAASTRTSSR